MDDIEPSARLYNEDGAEFMTITALYNSDTDEPLKTPITFVLRNNQLVTVRYADPKPLIGPGPVPIRLPSTMLSGPVMNTPPWELPEITLPDPAADPPIMQFAASTCRPKSWLGAARPSADRGSTPR